MAEPRGGRPSRSSTQHTYSKDDWLLILSSLIAFRLCNALMLRTFFQPDEYFQSLEPAWQIAFGEDSGAWITWEWREQLRSSLHPFLFASTYKIAVWFAHLLDLSPSTYADLLLAAPKVLQALFAASIDYYTWRLARKLHAGANEPIPVYTLLLSVCSPWQWFCSARTLSNCLETALTSAALVYWPWHGQFDTDGPRPGTVSSLRGAVILATIASILRPTNLLIWAVVTIASLWTTLTTIPDKLLAKLMLLVRELVICGGAVLILSAISDRIYYRQWAFPPLRFLHFNIVQSLAAFYGTNRGDYYITEGIPLLLTTALPFALLGFWSVVREQVRSTNKEQGRQAVVSETWPSMLAATVAVMISVLSLISHKEVRFIYPLLPVLHVLAGPQVWRFFVAESHWQSIPRRALLIALLTINLTLAAYASLVHQRGVVDVTHYLRREFETRYSSESVGELSHAPMSVAFLMPCHSTPWRSHLIHSGIQAWALTCEPPLDVPMSQRATYRDEADQFYDDTDDWLSRHMKSTETISQKGNALVQTALGLAEASSDESDWPDYLVFFEQLETTMSKHLEQTTYRQCWRGFNSHFHDDWRRHGDVVVWCLHET